MKALLIGFGIICGAFVGVALGIIAAIGLGYWSRWSNPADASAGSVVIVVLLTAPVGTMAGACLGGLTIASRPRLFFATFLPLAIFFLGLQITLSTLRGMDRPRNFILEVNGTPGVEYVGTLSVDGKEERLKGVVPEKFEFDAYRIELALALVNANEKNDISVSVTADGRNLHTGSESQTGIHLDLESVGYSEDFGGTSKHWRRMSPEDAESLVKRHAIPRGMGLP